MSQEHKVDRRRFLAAAGAGTVGALARPASAQSTLTIRRQAEIPYRPDVLVVGGGPPPPSRLPCCTPQPRTAPSRSVSIVQV